MKKRGLSFLIVVGLTVAFPSPAQAAHFSAWSAPENLGCGAINTAGNDFGPGISKDGLSLYFGRGNPPDIYVSQRSAVSAPWGPPVIVPNVNSAAADNVVSFSRDGHWMFLNSNRAGGFGDNDIWASYRSHVHDDFDWQTPVNLGPGVNSPGFEAGATYFENEGSAPELFFGRGPSASEQFTSTKIWMSRQEPDGTWGTASEVNELNSDFPYGTQRPSIRFDGLEIFFYSNRPGGQGGSDIWAATRPSVDVAWDEPENLGPNVNTAEADFQPNISADGLALYMAVTRTVAEGGCGGFDVYMSTRTKVNPGG